MKITTELRTSVNTYLSARVVFEILDGKKAEIENKLLNETEYFMSAEMAKRNGKRERILNRKDTWMMDKDDFHIYLLDLRAGLVAAGMNPQPVESEPDWSYLCPALSAEVLMADAARLVAKAGAAMLDQEPEKFVHRLFCAGMAKYHEFIDLLVKAVVNEPGYKKPELIATC